jgi:hypothetical protein
VPVKSCNCVAGLCLHMEHDSGKKFVGDHDVRTIYRYLSVVPELELLSPISGQLDSIYLC